MSRAAAPLAISDGQREVLETLAGSQAAAHRVVQRAQVLLLAADGVSNTEISEVVGVSRPTVLAWRGQFEKDGLIGFPKGLQIHMICDNYGTHKHANVKEWLAKHPRFHLHFTPTSSSWLNLVERWFRDLTDKAIRRGVFHGVNDLITAIEDYLEANNGNPKPFVWTATAEQILAKVARGRVALQQA